MVRRIQNSTECILGLAGGSSSANDNEGNTFKTTDDTTQGAVADPSKPPSQQKQRLITNYGFRVDAALQISMTTTPTIHPQTYTVTTESQQSTVYLSHTPKQRMNDHWVVWPDDR